MEHVAEEVPKKRRLDFKTLNCLGHFEARNGETQKGVPWHCNCAAMLESFLWDDDLLREIRTPFSQA